MMKRSTQISSDNLADNLFLVACLLSGCGILETFYFVPAFAILFCPLILTVYFDLDDTIPCSLLPDTVTSNHGFLEAVNEKLDTESDPLNSCQVTSKEVGNKDQEVNWGIPSLRVKDIKGKVITVNPELPVDFDSEYFYGKILVMVRTEGELSDYNRYANHFKGKQRKFEIQLQGKFKKIPQGTIMMGGEITNKLHLGLITRTLVKFILKFCITLISNLRFSFGEDPNIKGEYEPAYMSFPLFRAMDRVVETTPSESPPPLGYELPETNDHRNKRRAGKIPEIQYKLDCTYSFSFHSMYLDFSQWKICNIPGYHSLDITTFIGQQPFHIVVYEVLNEQKDGATGKITNQNEPHFICNRRYLYSLEFCHISNLTAQKDPTLTSLTPMSTATVNNQSNNQEEAESFYLSHRRHNYNSSADDVARDGDEEDEDNVAEVSSTTEAQSQIEEEYLNNMHSNRRNKNRNSNSSRDDRAADFADDSAVSESISFLARGSLTLRSPSHSRSPSLSRATSLTRSRQQSVGETPEELVVRAHVSLPIFVLPAPWETFHIEGDDLGLEDLSTTSTSSTVSTPIQPSSQLKDNTPDRTPEYARNLSSSRLSATPSTPTPTEIVTLNYNGKLEQHCEVRVLGLGESRRSGSAVRSHFSKVQYIRFLKVHTVDKELKVTAKITVDDDFDDDSENILKHGDVVAIRGASSKKFLKLSRGWWLRWSREETLTSKHFFLLQISENASNSLCLRPPTKGDPLTRTMPFYLRPVSHPAYEVGCYSAHSYEYGGCVLALFQSGKDMRSPARWLDGTSLNPLHMYIGHNSAAVVDTHRTPPPHLQDSGSTRYLTSSVSATPSPSSLTAQARLFRTSSQRSTNWSANSAASETSSVSGESTDQGQDYPMSPEDTRLLLDADRVETLRVEVTGWVEIFNKKTKEPRRAYIVLSQVETTRGLRSWTSYRDSEEIFRILTYLRNQLLNFGLDCDDWFGTLFPKSSLHLSCYVNHSSLMTSQSMTSQTMGVYSSRSDSIERVDSDNPFTLPPSPNPRNFKRLSSASRIMSLISPPESQTNSPLSVENSDENLTRLKSTISSLMSRSLPSESDEYDYISNNMSENLDFLYTQEDLESDFRDYPPYLTRESLGANEFDEIVKRPYKLVRRVLYNFLTASEVEDRHFLHGDVRRMIPLHPGQNPSIITVLIGRALWSTFWQEEVLQIFPAYMVFTKPYEANSSFIVAMSEILGISELYEDDLDCSNQYQEGQHTGLQRIPFIGYYIIRIETLARVHYLCVFDELNKDDIMHTIREGVMKTSTSSNRRSGIVMPSNLYEGNFEEKFCLRSPSRGSSSVDRLILNSRLFSFDNFHYHYRDDHYKSKFVENGLVSEGYSESLMVRLHDEMTRSGAQSYWTVSALLLEKAFELDPACCDETTKGLTHSRRRLISFLNLISCLRFIRINEINYHSPNAICFFVNLYHTLLIHSRIIAYIPSSSNWSKFYTTMSYEVGNDLFSLAELEVCVIRANLSHPQEIPRPLNIYSFVDNVKSKYGLSAVDPRINFILNNGSISNSPSIYLLTPETLYAQLRSCCKAVIDRGVHLDPVRKIITLPYTFHIYQSDYGSDNLSILRFCLRYLDKVKWEQISEAIEKDEINSYTIRFKDFKFECHNRLFLVEYSQF